MYVIGNCNTFKMICYKDYFKLLVKNNKDYFANGARLPDHFKPIFTLQIKYMFK